MLEPPLPRDSRDFVTAVSREENYMTRGYECEPTGKPRGARPVNTLSFEARIMGHQAREPSDARHAGFRFPEPGESNRNIIETLIERF